mgnify:CR=1 FL=1
MEKDRYFHYDGENPPMEVTIPNLSRIDGTNHFILDHSLMKDKSDRQYNAIMGKRYGIFRNPLLTEIIEFNKQLEGVSND